jgi:hypothetical protein
MFRPSCPPINYLFIADKLSGVIPEWKHEHFLISQETYGYKTREFTADAWSLYTLHIIQKTIRFRNKQDTCEKWKGYTKLTHSRKRTSNSHYRSTA